MTTIENLKGWGQRHRKGLVLLLVLILAAYVATGLWIKTEIDLENARHPHGCRDISCYLNQVPLVPCDQGTYDRAFAAEVAHRQEATREKYGLTAAEASAVVPYMGDWQGGPALIDFWPKDFTPGVPGCIPARIRPPQL